MKSAFEILDAELKLQHFKIGKFKPKIELSFARGRYIVKTVRTPEELESCLRLRYEVFHVEYRKKTRKFGVDIDKLDFACDHLAIVDAKTARVVGTYRLNSSLFNNVFYSSSEFEMKQVLEIPGPKLEMGRACIDKRHRNGVVIALLWRGIAEYIQKTGTKVLLGCGSIKTTDIREAALVAHYMAEGGYQTDQFGVVPTKKFRMAGLPKKMAELKSHPEKYSHEEAKKLVPALVKSYFSAGAKVCGEPALDTDFQCIDFLTVLLIDELSPLFKGKYKV